jgi:octaprenyl-diphosphate synthase
VPIDKIKALVSEDFEAVNSLIINRIQSEVGLIDDLSHHIVESGGKRLRPLLVLLASRACQYQGNQHVALAAMIEFFHTATLLHDDVVDESTLRRGRETANSIWGSKASILVGDYLFTQTIQLISDVGRLDILELISNTSHQVSCGEVKQLANRHNPSLSFEDYFEVIKSKTALLFAAATCTGALISNSDQSTVDNLYAYGLHLGNAFQLIDDALDYCSDAEVIGKNIGDDLADGKATLPLLHALEHGNASQKKQIIDSLKQGSLAHLNEIREAIKETKAIEYTKQYAQSEIDKAITALEVLPESEFKSALVELAHFAANRNH